MTTKEVNNEQLAINTIRTLSMDGVQASNSGHPGTPMALAPVAYVLFNEVMSYNPANPMWENRDRFILSCGHASMLLYSAVHLSEVKQVGANGKPLDEPAVPLDDIRRFRQLDSRCPGHPEYRHTGGVETTTGPLGQGIANSVGMAMAERWLAARYNKPGFSLFDYNVYALCSDGDLMEGVGAEAASIAGHLKLDLRRQHDYDRGAHRSRVQRGRWPAIRRLWLERRQGRRCERSARPPCGDRRVQADERSAHAHHRPQCDRLWLAEQGKHARSARRAAG
jgi:transketolase